MHRARIAADILMENLLARVFNARVNSLGISCPNPRSTGTLSLPKECARRFIFTYRGGNDCQIVPVQFRTRPSWMTLFLAKLGSWDM